MYQHNHYTKCFPCGIFHLSRFAFRNFLGDTLALIGLSPELSPAPEFQEISRIR